MPPQAGGEDTFPRSRIQADAKVEYRLGDS